MKIFNSAFIAATVTVWELILNSRLENSNY